jgi:prepilin-type processing-associated H-X9-DG protein
VKYSYAMNLYVPRKSTPIYPPPQFAAPMTNGSHFNPGNLRAIRDTAQFIYLVETTQYALVGHNSAQASFRFDHQKRKSMNILFADGHVAGRQDPEFLPQNKGSLNDQTRWPDGLRSAWFGKANESGVQLLP